VKTCISAKLVFHVSIKIKIWKFCAIELETKSSKLNILSLYRALTGDFNQCIEKQDDALKHLHKSKAEFLICGNVHTHYLIESNRKKN
jgi:hypothetical protein